MDWLSDNAWAGWLVVAAVLGVIEIASLDLLFAMVAVGALAGAAVSAVGAPFLLSLIVALAGAAAMLLVVRPVAMRHLHPGPATRTGIAALVGAEALVLERVDRTGGRIKLAGEVWSARTYDPDGVLEPGQTVDVYQIDGATAVVHGTGH